MSAEAGSGGGLQTLFTMAAGGLAGESPHMVAASVMALARLLFEFGGALSGVHLCTTRPACLPASTQLRSEPCSIAGGSWLAPCELAASRVGVPGAQAPFRPSSPQYCPCCDPRPARSSRRCSECSRYPSPPTAKICASCCRRVSCMEQACTDLPCRQAHLNLQPAGHQTAGWHIDAQIKVQPPQPILLFRSPALDGVWMRMCAACWP